ncbi:unnamed protein product [Spirodela intermedia]|uniref:Costars domain-containing protein n=1 Tax=Spirodela intermedia TaxID=51605 RepID=A0A7I8IZF9_SPIIN|nr:unnamed protein product [Spirodela intermedia]CAA6663092.1 unnamed protein product [Spirodela intermedia]
MNVEEEVEKLRLEITRLGQLQPDGSCKVKFGVLFHDDRCANLFEALVGTLRAAKRRKLSSTTASCSCRASTTTSRLPSAPLFLHLRPRRRPPPPPEATPPTTKTGKKDLTLQLAAPPSG